MSTKLIQTVVALFVFIGMCYGAEKHFAKQRELDEFSRSYQICTLENKLDTLQERKWKFEDKFNAYGETEQDMEDYRDILQEMDRVKRKIGMLTGEGEIP